MLFYFLAFDSLSNNLVPGFSPDHTIKIILTWPSAVQGQPPFDSYIMVDLNHPMAYSADEGLQHAPLAQLSLHLDPHFLAHWIFPHCMDLHTKLYVLSTRIRIPTREAAGADKQLSRLSDHNIDTQESIVRLFGHSKLSDMEMREAVS